MAPMLVKKLTVKPMKVKEELEIELPAVHHGPKMGLLSEKMENLMEKDSERRIQSCPLMKQEVKVALPYLKHTSKLAATTKSSNPKPTNTLF
jgi:hypothetical protein